jgi:hypothetical protein
MFLASKLHYLLPNLIISSSFSSFKRLTRVFLASRFFCGHILDGFVKSPDAALRYILRRCSVPKSTLHSSGFARLACKLFTKPSEN